MPIKVNVEKENNFIELINKGIFTVYKDGKVYSSFVNRFVGKPNKTDGYIKIGFKKNSNSRLLNVSIHRIIYRYFIGEIPENLYINHKDGNRANNHVNNLELVTPAENSQHGLKRGTKNRNRSFTDEQVIEMREIYASGDYSYNILCEKFKSNRKTVMDCVLGKSYKHIPMPEFILTKHTKINYGDESYKHIPMPEFILTKHTKINYGDESYILKSAREGYFKVFENGSILNTKTNRFIGETDNPKQYSRVSKSLKGHVCHMSTHRLVYIFFKGYPPNDTPLINHIDGNKRNNSLSNLEPVNHTGNMAHAKTLNLFDGTSGNNSALAFGEDNRFSILTQEQADSIRTEYNEHKRTQKYLSIKYNVSIQAIRDIVKNRRFTKNEKPPRLST